VHCRSRGYVKEATASASALAAASEEEIYAIDSVTRSAVVSLGTSPPWDVTPFGYGTTLLFVVDSSDDVTIVTAETCARLRRPRHMDSTAAKHTASVIL